MLASLKYQKKKEIRLQISPKLLVKEYLETLERMVRAVLEYFVTASPLVVSVIQVRDREFVVSQVSFASLIRQKNRHFR